MWELGTAILSALGLQCDRKRPSCGQCIHHGLKCDGYGRETIFVNAMSGRAEQYRIERPRREAIVPPDADPETLARTAREELYIGSFWHRYLPEAREFQPRAVPYTNGGWTVALPKLYGASPLIRKIMLAVCLAMAGRTAARERDREEGLRYYTSSLEGMARALKDGRKVDHTTLIVTARLFSLYEVGRFPPFSCRFSPFFYLFPKLWLSEDENGPSYLPPTASLRTRPPGSARPGGQLAEAHHRGARPHHEPAARDLLLGVHAPVLGGRETPPCE